MQKVEGSSPFSRFARKPRNCGAFSFSEDRAANRLGRSPDELVPEPCQNPGSVLAPVGAARGAGSWATAPVGTMCASAPAPPAGAREHSSRAGSDTRPSASGARGRKPSSGCDAGARRHRRDRSGSRGPACRQRTGPNHRRSARGRAAGRALVGLRALARAGWLQARRRPQRPDPLRACRRPLAFGCTAAGSDRLVTAGYTAAPAGRSGGRAAARRPGCMTSRGGR